MPESHKLHPGDEALRQQAYHSDSHDFSYPRKPSIPHTPHQRDVRFLSIRNYCGQPLKIIGK